MKRVLDEPRQWPINGLESVNKCPACGCSERALLYEGLTDNVFFCSPGRWSLHRCTACKSAFLDPRPTLETISLAYNSYYTHEAIVSYDRPSSIFWRIKRRLRNDYLNNRYHVHLTPTWLLGRWLIPLVYKKRAEEYLRHLPGDRGLGSVLDIGCGNGGFLRIAMQMGWEAWGVDFDPKAVERASKTGATVMQCGLPNTGLPTGRFDAVTLSHVIEHVHDPIATLQEVYRILRPGGQVWIGTPNLGSYSHSRFRQNWRGLEPPRHIVIFTRDSLRNALIKAGFINVEFKPSTSMATWFYRSSFRISQGEDPNDDQALGLPIVLRIAAKLANCAAVLLPSRSENIVVIANRPTD